MKQACADPELNLSSERPRTVPGSRVLPVHRRASAAPEEASTAEGGDAAVPEPGIAAAAAHPSVPHSCALGTTSSNRPGPGAGDTIAVAGHRTSTGRQPRPSTRTPAIPPTGIAFRRLSSTASRSRDGSPGTEKRARGGPPSPPPAAPTPAACPRAGRPVLGCRGTGSCRPLPPRGCTRPTRRAPVPAVVPASHPTAG